ncbi:MAG: amino acid ABC transporter permease [Anaerolineae bacterium]
MLNAEKRTLPQRDPLAVREHAVRRPGLAVDRWWILVLGVGSVIAALVVGWPDPFWRMLQFLVDGLWVTVSITGISFVLILGVGLLGGLGRVSPRPLLRNITAFYVEVVRGIPLLVQLLFIYYAFPQVLDIAGEFIIETIPAWSDLGETLVRAQLSPFWAAVAGLTICYGAYMTEVFRAGIESVPHGQLEAALALGMNRRQAMGTIILPQAIRVALPPIGNDFIALLKDSSLVSVVAVADLTRRGREFISTTFIPLEGWTMVALLYLVLTLVVSRGVAAVERRSGAYAASGK